MLEWFIGGTVFLLVSLFSFVILFPYGRRVTLDGWPGLLDLYAQAGIAVIRKSGSKSEVRDSQKQEPPLEVSLVKPQAFNQQRLEKFLSLAKYPQNLKGVPLMYPICESFRLNIQALLLPAFPFSVLRTVLKSISTTMYRELWQDEALSYKVEINPSSYTRTEKGHIEVDIVSKASSSSDKSLVWRTVVRAVVLNPKAAKGGGSAAAGPLEQEKLEVIDTWRHGADVGRKYGALNGDLNPIHLHAMLSKMFGFKRPIAHALFQLSCTEASLRKHGVSFKYPIQMDVECKRPTLLPATLHCALDKRTEEKGVVHFAVLTEDKAKEVLVGKLFKAPPAEKK